jgi:hypothetical protein
MACAIAPRAAGVSAIAFSITKSWIVSIMGGRISEGPSSSMVEHDDRYGIPNLRGSDKV